MNEETEAKKIEYLICGCDNGSIQLWDLKENTKLANLNEGERAVYSLCTLNDSFQLASGSSDRNIKIWSLIEFNAVQTLIGHEGIIFSLLYLSDAKCLISGFQRGKIKIWKKNEQLSLFGDEPVFTCQAHLGDVNALISLPDNMFASGSTDSSIKIWRLDRKAFKADCTRTLTGHTQSVRCLTHLSNGGNFIASGSHDSTIKVWDYTKSTEAVHTLSLNNPGQEIYVYSLATLQDSNLFASGLGSRIKICKMKTDGIVISEEKPLEGHLSYVRCLAWLGVEPRLASGSMDMKIKIWDSTNGNLLKEFETDPATNIYSLVYFKK